MPGLERVFLEEFPHAGVQRCQIHVSNNVLANVPRKLKKTIADELRAIFYASSKDKAYRLFDRFKNTWQKKRLALGSQVFGKLPGVFSDLS